MAHTCRGTINLSTAHFDTEDSCSIVLTSGARTYHLKASSEVERQQWITALELAKAKAVCMMSSHSGSEHLVSGYTFSVMDPERLGLESVWGVVVTRRPRLVQTNPGRLGYVFTLPIQLCVSSAMRRLGGQGWVDRSWDRNICDEEGCVYLSLGKYGS